MRRGVVFPQTEIGADPVAVIDYVQTAEDLGYSHLVASDHVLGADTQFHQGWTGGYASKDMFHEPQQSRSVAVDAPRRLFSSFLANGFPRVRSNSYWPKRM